MADSREKRSSGRGAALELVHQVGGRQPDRELGTGGGGYQGSRTAPTSHLADPRLAELERMGLARPWLRIAEEIGVEAFTRMWKILDEEFPEELNGRGLRIWMRSYQSYLRFQRNRFIESLVASGLSLEQIRARVLEELGEKLGPRHISRIARGK